MTVGRNEPCPCGSGKKYKKCCAATDPIPEPAPRPTPRFRFEHGSYGGPGRQYMPSAICHEQTAPGQWREGVTARLNRVYEREASELDAVVSRLQTLSIPRETWATSRS